MSHWSWVELLIVGYDVEHNIVDEYRGQEYFKSINDILVSYFYSYISHGIMCMLISTMITTLMGTLM